MEKNKNGSACNIKLDEDNYKKDKTICKNFFIEKKGKNKNITTLIQNQEPRNYEVNKNNINRSTLLVGLCFSGKTFLMLKVVSRIPPDRDVCIITKSLAEQYSNSKSKFEKIWDEIKPVNEYEHAIIFFDDFLGSSKSSHIDQFFVGGRYNNSDIYYLPQS